MHLPDSKIISSGPEKVRDRSRRFAGSRVDWREHHCFGSGKPRNHSQLQHLAGWPRATCSTFWSCDCICRMVTRVIISQGSCSYVHHSKCSLNTHYFHYHWGILTKAQPPFLSLSRSHIHTFAQLATLNVHEDSYPFLPPTSATSADFTSRIFSPAPSLLHSKVVSLCHAHSHPIIHSTHMAKLIFKQVKQTPRAILLLSLKFSK